MLSAQQADLVRAIVAARENGRPVAWDKLRGNHAPESREALDLRRALIELTDAGVLTFSGPDRSPQTVNLTRTIGERAATELGPTPPPARDQAEIEAAVEALEVAAEAEFAEGRRREAARRTNEIASQRLDEVARHHERLIEVVERATRLEQEELYDGD